MSQEHQVVAAQRQGPLSMRSVIVLLCGLVFILGTLISRDPITALVCSVSITAQSILGTWVISKAWETGSTSTAMTLNALGPGLALGSTATTLLASLFGIFGIFAVFGLTAIVVIFGKPAVTRSLGPKFPDAKFVLMIALILLIQFSLWSVTILGLVGLCASCLAISMFRDSHRSVFRLLIGFFSLAALALLVFLPRFWWARSDDFPYFVTVVEGIRQFGAADSLAVAGQGIRTWHWLTFGWIASINPIQIGDVWTQTIMMAPMAAGASSIASLSLLVRRASRLQLRGALGVSAVTFLILGGESQSLSYIISLSWLLGAVCIFVCFDVGRRAFFVITILVMAVAIVGGKPSNSPLLLLILGVGCLTSWKHRVPRHTKILVFVSATLSSIFYQFNFYGQGTSGSNIWIQPFSFLRTHVFENEHQTLSFILIIVSIAITGLFVLSLLRHSRTSEPYLLISSFGSYIFYVLLLGGWADSVDYFVLPSQLIFCTIIVGVCSRDIRELSARLTFRNKMLLVMTMIVAVFTQFLLKVFDVQPLAAISGSSSIVLIGVLVLICSLRLIFLHRRPFVVGMLTLTSLFAFGFSQAIIPSRASTVHELTQSRTRVGVEEQLGLVETQLVGQWIKANLDKNSILATNYFCLGSKLCADSSWVDTQLSYIALHPGYLVDGCDFCSPSVALGGADYSLSAYSARRFVLLGPRFQSGAQVPPIQIQRRLRESVNAPDSWIVHGHASFSDSDADYLVIFVPYISDAAERSKILSRSLFHTTSFAIVES